MTSVLVAETASNQSFVYRSNRLREAIGASYLVSCAGTEWVDAAIAAVGAADIEVVVSTSGKAILVGERRELAAVAEQLTLRVLTDAPGMVITCGIAALEHGDSLFDGIRTAFRRLEENRAELEGPDSRFQRLPLVASCASTGLPAGLAMRVRGSETDISFESAAKRNAADQAISRLRSLVDSALVARTVDDLDEVGRRWISVVHADGNGVGRLFLAFDAHLRAVGRSDVLDSLQESIGAYRRLSKAVERCTTAAFGAALASLESDGRPGGVVPVLLGGDDITVVASGELALDLAERHLREFAAATAADDDLCDLGVEGLTASASLVYTKPHFPYWAAHEMATSLLAAAKATSRTVSPNAATGVIDLHVVYDSSSTDLEEARRRHLASDSGHRLWGGPYALDECAGLDCLADLRALAGLMADRRRGPSSAAVHDVRSRLTTFGTAVAERRMSEVPALSTLVPLRRPTYSDGSVLLLDALDLVDVDGAR